MKINVIYETADETPKDEWIVIIDVASLEPIFRGNVPANFIAELHADDDAAYYESDSDHPGEKGTLVEEAGIAAYIFDRAGSKDFESPIHTIHLDTRFDAFLEKYADRNKVKPKREKIAA